MGQDAILAPLLAMMALTGVVWFYMYLIRIPAMKKAPVAVQTYTTPDKVIEHLPEAVSYPAYNLKNLFELPVLFYALCLYLFVTKSVDSIHVVSAWVFFGCRVAHSIVHCTSNIVMTRFYLYAAAAIALWFMLIRTIYHAV